MIARKLPSLNALRAFEAAARHQSFTLAAQELCVTQGAVSHQVKALEEELQLRLFQRRANRLQLTRAGERYLETVREAFDRIEAATRDLGRRRGGRGLAVSTSPNFAAKWLVPRLGRFTEKYPAADIALELSAGHADFAGGEIDLAIRYGDGAWPGLQCVRLSREYLLPVAAPGLPVAASRQALARQALLHAHDHGAWAKWLEAEGEKEAALRGLVFNQESAVIDAAVAGQGVALARSTLVVHDLAQQRLVLAFDRVEPIGESYWLVRPAPAGPSSAKPSPAVPAFQAWLLEEFEADQRFLAQLGVGG